MESQVPSELNTVQIVMLAAFPVLEKAFLEKIQEGYRPLTINYNADVKTASETLEIFLNKGYERFFLRQEKGHYAGGYSHVTFGREGERGEILTGR